MTHAISTLEPTRLPSTPEENLKVQTPIAEAQQAIEAPKNSSSPSLETTVSALPSDTPSRSLEDAFEQLIGKKYSQLASPDVIDRWILAILNASFQGDAAALKKHLGILANAHPVNQKPILFVAYELAKQKKNEKCCHLLLNAAKTEEKDGELYFEEDFLIYFDKDEEIKTNLIFALTPDQTPSYMKLGCFEKKREEDDRARMRDRDVAYYHAGNAALENKNFEGAHSTVKRIKDFELSQDLGYRTDLSLFAVAEKAVQKNKLEKAEAMCRKIKNPLVKERLQAGIDTSIFIEGMKALQNNDLKKARQSALGLKAPSLRDKLWMNIAKTSIETPLSQG